MPTNTIPFTVIASILWKVSHQFESFSSKMTVLVPTGQQRTLNTLMRLKNNINPTQEQLGSELVTWLN